MAFTWAAQPRATATLALQIDATDAQVVSRYSQAALAQANKAAVFGQAASKLKMDPQDVRRVTDLAASPDSLIINVRARDASPEQAVEVANQVATAIVEASQAEVQAQLKDLETATAKLIQTPAIGDAAAERARVTRLGEGLADNQSRVVARANTVRALQPAQLSTVELPATRDAGLAGLAGGLLLGALAVMLLGARRGRIRHRNEVAALYPDAIILGPSDIADLVRDADRAVRRVVLLSAEGDDVLHRLHDLLEASFASASAGEFDVFVGRPGGVMHDRAARDAEALVLVPVLLGQTRIQDLDRQVQDLSTAPALLLIDPTTAMQVRNSQTQATEVR